MTLNLGIVGYPIGHSISPVFQQAALDHFSIDAIYQAWEVSPQALPPFIEGLRSPDTLGSNVTVPHKEAVLEWLDDVDPWAIEVGAVNTIVNRQDKLSGYNTDSYGFLRALIEHGNFIPEGRTVLVLGAGGAAKGVAIALAREGVSSLTIANRTLSRGKKLVMSLKGQREKATAIPLEGQTVARAADCDLIVNCTTLGMKHGPDEGLTPLVASQISPRTLVYDLVYNPPMTPLLREAQKAGAKTIGGLPMLVYQGAASFELWTGREGSLEVMMAAARKALGSQKRSEAT